MTPIQLKQARQLLGFTQDELAEKIGMSRKMIGMMERGQKPIELRTALAVRCLLYDAELNADKR